MKSESKKYLAKTNISTALLDTHDIEKKAKDYMDIVTKDGKCFQKGDLKHLDVPGCGGSIDLECNGGCIEVQKVRYSCEEINKTISDQFEIVKERCESKENCNVPANRETFGNKVCPRKTDNDMSLWISYRCNGQAADDKSKTAGQKRCPKTTTEAIMTTTSNGDKCFKKGLVKQLDTPGCGGRIELECKGGCIEVHKVRYSCKEIDESIAKQFQIVKEKCQNKERCEVTASRSTFGNEECRGTSESEMLLWIGYSCNGETEEDKSRVAGKKRCPKDTTERTTKSTIKQITSPTTTSGITMQVSTGSRITMQVSTGSKITTTTERTTKSTTKQKHAHITL